MRMVYTSAPEATFYPARGRLALRFERWARHRGRPADLSVVEALLEFRWAGGDGLLGRWRPDDLETALLDWFPRKVALAPQRWADVVPIIKAFVDFLVAQGLTDRYCAEPQQLHTTLDKLVEPFAEAMADQTRYSLAKYWSVRMIRDGIDPADQAAARRFMADLQAGRLAVHEELLDQLMANQLLDARQRHPVLPVVAVPDDGTLRRLAEHSPVVWQLRELVRWVGYGRLLTATGRIQHTEAREFLALLGTADVIDPVAGDRMISSRSEEPYGLTVLVAWARAASLLRVDDNRLVPVEGMAEVLGDPLTLARRAFGTLFDIGEAVCRSGWAGPGLRRFEDVVLDVAIALYITPEPLPVTAIRQLAFQSPDAPPEGPAWAELGGPAELEPGGAMRTRPGGRAAARPGGWATAGQEGMSRRLAGSDTDRLLDQLRRLGAIEAHDPVALNPLGIGLVAAHLRDIGVPVPTVDGLRDETAEVVVAHAAAAEPKIATELLAAWYANNPGIARSELRALAERTDDADHRRLAQSYARRWVARRIRRRHR